MPKRSGTTKITRDAKTGRFLPSNAAISRPGTEVIKTIKRKRR